MKELPKVEKPRDSRITNKSKQARLISDLKQRFHKLDISKIDSQEQPSYHIAKKLLTMVMVDSSKTPE